MAYQLRKSRRKEKFYVIGRPKGHVEVTDGYTSFSFTEKEFKKEYKKVRDKD